MIAETVTLSRRTSDTDSDIGSYTKISWDRMITITQTGPEGILHVWKNDVYKILNLCTVSYIRVSSTD